MQVLGLLHERSAKCLCEVHAARRRAVWAGVEALLRGGRLWLTALGRHVGGEAKERHNIKRMDRLLGNEALGVEREDWYRWLCACVLGSQRRPVVLVDWSQLGERDVFRHTLPRSFRDELRMRD